IMANPDDDDERLWVPVVCNLVPPQPLLRYVMTNTPIRIGKGTHYVNTLTYLGISATTLADLQAQARSTPKKDLAKRIIGNMCSQGERHVPDVLQACAAAGVNEKTARQAAHELGVDRNARVTGNGSKALSYWMLPKPKPIKDDEAEDDA